MAKGISIRACLLTCTVAAAGPATAQELAASEWHRDFDEALAIARKQKKPLLVYVFDAY